MKINNSIRKRFVEHIYHKLKASVTGSDADKVYGDKPSSQFFAGTLCSQDAENLNKKQTMITPMRIGLEFLLKKSDIENAILHINPTASVFYKIIPSYEEHIDSVCRRMKMTKEELLKTLSEKIKSNEDTIDFDERPVSVFKKINLENLKIVISLAEILNGKSEGKIDFPEIKQVTDNAKKIWKSDISAYKAKKLKKNEMDSKIPASALLTKEDFDNAISEWGEKELEPDWEWKLTVNAAEFLSDSNKNCIKITVTLENSCTEKGGDNIDNYLFNANLKINVEGAEIQNFIIDYLNDHYRYDGNMGASGINCEAILNKEENCVYSENVPMFKQYRIKTSDTLKPKFGDLASDNSLNTLREVSSQMKKALEEYRKNLPNQEKRKIAFERFSDDIKTFENEIKRFDFGIDTLEKYPMALRAFKNMNKSFQNSSKSYDSWRTFQIIFIVMNIPDIVSTEVKEIKSTINTVEVLYFGTGGGKTETYLGLSIFTLFFDRLRGKKVGNSIITKFPLRLLSLQQIQRIANVIAQAELVRRTDSLINSPEHDEFSMGYFVGDRNTPNKLVERAGIFGGADIDRLTPIKQDVERIERGEVDLLDENLDSRKYLIISKCPFCGSNKVMIDADVEKIRLLHRCMNKDCKEDTLPIYISDIEIYRYIPSFLISTLDKIAVCGQQKNFRNIFGQVTHKCPTHGYTNSPNCTEKTCRTDKAKIVPVSLYDPVPSIQVQDEMHLVRESLGTFNSHYESFLENFERNLTNGRSMKIIAATATISEYKMQTDHLYAREAIQFPSQGPSLKESFYSAIDESDLNKLIVGISPHNKTIIFSVIELIRRYNEIIQTYYNNPESLNEVLQIDSTSQEIKAMLDDYKIMLTYHQAKNDGDRISHSVRSMANRYLRDKNLKEIRQKALTGDVSFSDVRIVLDKIENPKNDDDEIDLIIATSMISHGVDLNKLNFMIFQGMPRNTAEYIQASSRVGRMYPGIVFVIFNPTRERDQSYFKFFAKFHEYKDLLVEAVPINRWAKFSINRTIPGIFTASILNYFDIKTMPTLGKSINMSKTFSRAINNNMITKEQITNFLMDCYKVDRDTVGFGFDEIIKEKVEFYTDEIVNSSGNDFISKPMLDKPMMSLRDVDTLIEIILPGDSINVLSKLKGRKTSQYDEEDEE